jgi:hypothetical protein
MYTKQGPKCDNIATAGTHVIQMYLEAEAGHY